MAINMTPVKSSQIHSIGHEPVTNTLAICFNGRGNAPSSLYHYSNVSADDFATFSGADSVGSHFYRNIKPRTDRFPYQRINEEKTEE
ncbi:KTSC domain-containing protein [Pectobacterium carotovorum]|uniref:KTSC domain-containing protein n=1 Tax=Pectobacterium carotovorum TaxID=554 RepID=UPI00301918F8